MFPRILARVTELLKVNKQFGLEFEELGSHTWVILRTWRNEDHVAVGVISQYYGDASNELVVLGKINCAYGSGRLWCQFLGGYTRLLSALRSILGAGARQCCWTTEPSMSDCSNAAYKSGFYSVRNAISYRDDRILDYSSKGC